MPYNKAELHYAKATLYQEFEPERENRIYPFNATILKEEENDGKAVKPKRPPKIRRITKPDGKVVYEF